jgi:EmrB/QacA subfamily drug resistance transporter
MVNSPTTSAASGTSTGAAGTRSRVPSWAVLAIAATAQLMVVLDVSVVFVALPSMRTSLHLSTEGQQWVVNAYTLTFAGFLLLGGRAGDYFGRKRIFLIGLSLFVLSSLAGGFSQTDWQLVTARTVQGVASALLAPATLSLLTTTYTEPRARARALGIWAAMAATGGAIGSAVGGILTDLLSWRWVLFINVPIGALLIAGAAVALPSIKGSYAGLRNLDLPGAATVTAGLALVIYAIVGTDSRPWADSSTLIPLIAGLALLVIFVGIESRAANPLVPLRIFKLRALTRANLIAICLGCMMFGNFFFVSLYLQQVLGYSPLRSGLSSAPGGAAVMLGSFVATRLVARLGARTLIAGGSAIGAVGFFWLAQEAVNAHYWSQLLPSLLLATFGLGLSFVPMTVAATAGVRPQEAGLAAGLLNTSRQIGGAIGLAALATIAANRTASALADHQRLPQALTLGYDRALYVSGAIGIAAVLIALTLPKLVRPTSTTSAPTAADAASDGPMPAGGAPANTATAATSAEGGPALAGSVITTDGPPR